jgi:hypothetical protein
MLTKETATAKGFDVLRNKAVMEITAQELGGLDAGVDRIKIPSAGSTEFEMPRGSDGKAERVATFAAVILLHHPLFVFYKDEFAGGNNAPDCCSIDGVTGEGNPGGECAVCPLNKFGTGKNGAKACKNRHNIYLLREGDIFPLVLSLPTGSLRELGKYIKSLITEGRATNCVVTRFSLQEATNKKGQTYSQAVFSMERELVPEEQGVIATLTEQVKNYSARVVSEVGDV